MVAGTLEKMEIIGYSDEGFSAEVGKIKVQMNPSGYHQTKKHNYTETPVIGGVQVFRFGNEDAEKQTFEFLFDATLASVTQIPKSVKKRIDHFIDLIYNVNGNSHKPNNLLLSWGTLQFKCFCESIDVEYTHFNASGTPVRAKIKADFKEKITHKQHRKEVQFNSPDMTHYKVISAGVNLPLIAHQIYNDPSYCIELAAFNQLDSFRNLKYGREIIAPPLKTTHNE